MRQFKIIKIKWEEEKDEEKQMNDLSAEGWILGPIIQGTKWINPCVIFYKDSESADDKKEE